MEGLQKVLKTMSNEMMEIKNQVAETSTKKPFTNFRRNQSNEPKSPNSISNAKLYQDGDEDEDTILSLEEAEEDKILECHGMWEFILPNFDNSSEQEALPVNTESKIAVEPVQTNPKKKNRSPISKDKAPMKKTPVVPTQNQPSFSNPPSSSKTLVVLDSMDYNIVEDMKKTRENIYLFDLSKLKHQ